MKVDIVGNLTLFFTTELDIEITENPNCTLEMEKQKRIDPE